MRLAKSFRVIAFTLLSAALSSIAVADALAESKPVATAAQSALIDEILELSGVRRALESIAGQIEEEIANPNGEYSGVPEAQREELRDIMLEAYSPERLMADMKQVLAEKYSAPLYETVRTKLNSAQGKRLTELEAQLTVTDVQERLNEYAATLQAAPPSTKRRRLIAELDKAALTTETILDLNVASFGAVALSAREQEKPLDEKALKKSLNAIRAKLRPAVTDQASLMLLYVHRDVPDSELKGYVDFYREKNMAAMGSIVRKGFGRAMSNGFNEMVKRARNIRGDSLRT